MAIGKSDQHARLHWGEAYDAIPKSLFATVAWHLANRIHGEENANGEVEALVSAEIEALARNGIIPQDQAKRARKIIDA